MENFNLIDSPWIPVRWLSETTGDTPHLVSLHDAFARGSEIADLDCAPHERIALIRLLVCITHAALGAPEDSEDWEGFGDDMNSAIPQYLHQPHIHPHFNLLGDGPRFLQATPSSGELGEPYIFSKISFHLSSGNNPKLLDHWGNEERPWGMSEMALTLLCLQNFFVGGSMASKVKGNGPALKSLQMLLCGPELHTFVLRNCLDLRAISQTGGILGKPVWEQPPDTSLLARLAPTPCALWVHNDLQHIHINQGYQYPEYDEYRDPFVTTQVIKGEKRVLLRAKPSHGIWRDLHLLTNLSKSGGNHSPLNLECFHDRSELGGYTELWVGELIKAKDAKIEDIAESTFSVPHSLFSNTGRSIYQSGIEYAELISQKLYGAIKTCYSLEKHENPPIEQGQRHYWHTLDQNHRILIQFAGDPETRRGQVAFGDPAAQDEWTCLVRKAAVDAYNAVCPRTTPRQLQAYSAGYKSLHKGLYQKNNKNAA